MSFTCEGCGGTDLQNENGRYEGRPVRSWGQIMICNLCREWGIVLPKPILEAHLAKLAVSLNYNEDGSLIVPP